MKLSDMRTLDQIEVENDFETDGEQSWCKHCGAIKEATAQFFKEHARLCVEPRRRLREGV